MKFNKIISALAIAAMALVPAAAFAQGLKIITKDGKSTLIPYDKLEKVTVYTGKPEVVDLGLSVKWHPTTSAPRHPRNAAATSCGPARSMTPNANTTS